MKTRQGFVSNSSSTSFYIDSSKYSYDKVVEAIKRMLELLSFCENSSSEDIDSICKVNKNVDRDSIISEMRDFYGGGREYEIGHLPKNIISVDSIEDNSIPWAVQEFLCEVLGARRQHWG